MFMAKEDMDRYPNGTLLLKSLDVSIRKTPRVREAFLQACTADDQTQSTGVAEKIALERALRWGTGPRIDVHQGLLRATESGKVVDACGFQSPYTDDLILLTSVWFDAFELGTGADKDKNAYRLTRTLLHEMVHWVRDAAKASDLILVGGLIKGSYREAGAVFEEMAYGTGNICTSDEVFDALASIGPSGERQMIQWRTKT